MKVRVELIVPATKVLQKNGNFDTLNIGFPICHRRIFTGENSELFLLPVGPFSPRLNMQFLGLREVKPAIVPVFIGKLGTKVCHQSCGHLTSSLLFLALIFSSTGLKTCSYFLLLILINHYQYFHDQ